MSVTLAIRLAGAAVLVPVVVYLVISMCRNRRPDGGVIQHLIFIALSVTAVAALLVIYFVPAESLLSERSAWEFVVGVLPLAAISPLVDVAERIHALRNPENGKKSKRVTPKKDEPAVA